LPPRLLLVEDDYELSEALATVLRDAGYEVDVAPHGALALTHLRAGGPRPAAILLDLMMPVMDGFEFLDRMQQNDGWAGIPVVVVTAMDLGAEELDLLQNATRKVIAKGATTGVDIRTAIREVLRPRPTPRAAAAG